MPRISVLLPFDRADTGLDTAVRSIVAQTFANWELIAVRNGSDSQARQAADALPAIDPRIRLVHEPERGIAHALNAGLRQARGEWIARMDADDHALPDRLAKQIGFADSRPDIGVVATQTHFESSMPRSEGFAEYAQWQNSLIEHDDHCRARFIESPLAHPTVMFRRSLIREYGPYTLDPVPEDYELWLRWFERGVRFHKLPEPLLVWRDRADRLSRRHAHYSREAFYNVKCRYLARWLSQTVPASKKIVIGGAGKLPRMRAELLEQHGVSVYGFTDVKEVRNKRIRFVPIACLTSPEEWFLISFISKRGVGADLSAYFTCRGFREGRDFVLAA